MVRLVRTFYFEIVSILVFGTFLFLLFSRINLFVGITDWTRNLGGSMAPELQNLFTIFMSIFIEGLPFILIGVFVSSLIQVYVKEETIWRWVPKSPWLSIPLTTLMGLLLPICECGIVPVARRLIQKGLPSYVAFTFLIAAPVINPVTIISTYIAFGENWEMTALRVLLVANIAILMGLLFYLFFSHTNVVKEKIEQLAHGDHSHSHEHGNHDHHTHSHRHHHHSHDHDSDDRFFHALYHAIFEFIDMGKYYVAGALIAATFQTFIGMSVIRHFTSNEVVAILVMMVLAFGISLCSSADAFVAASFRTAMGTAPLLAFLVFGPIMDLKNLMMMMGGFRRPVVLFFLGGTVVCTFLSVLIFL